MASLRLSIPIRNGVKWDRQDFFLHIDSVKEWHAALQAGCQRQLPYYKPRPAVLTGDNSTSLYRRSGLGARQHNRKNDSRQLGECPACEREPHAVDNKEISDSPSTLTGLPGSKMGSIPLKVADPDEERTRKHRNETQEILEGTRHAVPNREYSGNLALLFRSMAKQEMETESMCARHMREEALYSPVRPLRGWRFLRKVILSKLNLEDSQHFGPYNKSQHVFMLTIEEIRGKGRIHEARNLDACNMQVFLKYMARLEERGWRDVLWVLNSGDSIPPSVDLEGDYKDLLWDTSG